ncbi:peroxiredoxin-like family protein [Aquimarina aggregata]|uniref:peroxiredoxin-like family protein n=1 Tax=Aquimarina aggregata TaxID=1642818 RepID=UPI00249182B2|nr:peroxiredoxin-like family protein [Aquimarina aggregata]
MILQKQTEHLRQNILKRMPKSIVDTFKTDISQLKKQKLKENALQVGDTLPNSILRTINNDVVNLQSLHTSNFLIINFYRGGWCPYCNMELREYERLQNEFKVNNTNIISISAELPNLANQTSNKNTISHPILTDTDATFMKEIGIIFKLSKNAQKDFAGFGMDFVNIHGNENYELPVPAVYVVDKGFRIIFRYFEEDYMKRLEPLDLLNFLKDKNN